MISNIELMGVSKKIKLSSGLMVVLLDKLGTQNNYNLLECARNVFLVDLSGKVVWQVTSDFDVDGGPFTNIFNEDGQIKGYRWDGGLYKINVENGYASPICLMK